MVCLPVVALRRTRCSGHGAARSSDASCVRGQASPPPCWHRCKRTAATETATPSRQSVLASAPGVPSSPATGPRSRVLAGHSLEFSTRFFLLACLLSLSFSHLAPALSQPSDLSLSPAPAPAVSTCLAISRASASDRHIHVLHLYLSPIEASRLTLHADHLHRPPLVLSPPAAARRP